jgi:hypothetical protein
MRIAEDINAANAELQHHALRVPIDSRLRLFEFVFDPPNGFRVTVIVMATIVPLRRVDPTIYRTS